MQKVRIALAGVSAMLMLAAAGCGGDNGSGNGGDNGSGNGGDNGSGNGSDATIGTADVDASSVTFMGEDLPVHSMVCTAVAVEDDALRVIAEVGDPDDNTTLIVNETGDGAWVELVRGAGDPDFNGHRWNTPGDSASQSTIDFDGARSDLEMRWDTHSGQDEPDEGGPAQISFDLVCS